MKILLTLITLLFTMTLHAQQLTQHRWQNRLIVLVCSGQSEAMLEDQMAILAANEAGLEERKLLVYQFKEDTFHLGLCADQGWQTGSVPNYLAKKTDIETSFTFFLIGLDGGVKMQRNDVVPIADIYELIDVMPMRQAELNRQHE